MIVDNCGKVETMFSTNKHFLANKLKMVIVSGVTECTATPLFHRIQGGRRV
jgi:hypothetical protein